MKIQLIYRNYRNLHSCYRSYIINPPNGVRLAVPKPRKLYKFPKLFWTYRKVKKIPIFRRIINWMASQAFSRTKQTNNFDLYHFINMIPGKKMNTPYVVEVEHMGALMNFIFNDVYISKVKQKLMDPECRAIICSSKAAERSLHELLGRDFKYIKNKTHVIYPSIDRELGDSAKNETYKPNSTLKLLFVGNDCLRKGLGELLVVIRNLQKAGHKIKLTVVSNDAEKILKTHPEVRGVDLHDPRLSKQEIISRFFSKADIFVFPTKQDTFGYVLFDALSSGVPVISTKQFAVGEIVEDGEDGWLLPLTRSVLDEGYFYDKEKSEYVNRHNLDNLLVEGLGALLTDIAKNPDILKNYRGKAIHKFVDGGVFSIKTRNQQIKKLYLSALK